MKRLLKNEYTPTVLGIISIALTILIPFFFEWAKKGQGTNPETTDASAIAYGWIVGFVIIVIILNIVSVTLSIRQRKKLPAIDVISKLCVLQNAYILSPNYVTSQKHSRDSLEEQLEKGGSAQILTNSLKYDIFYASSIANNLVCGARYIYFLPQNSLMLDELANFIVALSNQLMSSLINQSSNHITVDDIRENNLEFLFFDEQIPCLYNFATFKQASTYSQSFFKQDWWYINPPDTISSSHMLTHEITEPRDQKDLDNVFARLSKMAIKTTGQKVYNSRNALSNFLGGILK
ncbi:MAG TPA: hypothetical protein DCG34_01235 [Clostridiales bacterium]|nr:hypothetical protein [Clostridiales bacterium]